MSAPDEATQARSLPALLSADGLLSQLGDPRLLIADATVVRTASGLADPAAGETAWERAHIPGSRHADLVAAFSDAASPFGFTNPGPARVAAAFEDLGVRPDMRLVIYDDEDRSMWATRLWWLAHSIGLDNAQVLDGGWAGWSRAGFAVETGPHLAPAVDAPRRERLLVRPTDAFIGTGDVIARLDDPEASPLICALDTDLFTGQEGDSPRRGHIPGATNVPARTLIRADRTFRDPDTLSELLAAYRGADPVDIYCGGGISATVVAFALVNLGWPRVRVYDGSFEEWAADPSLPLELGR